MLKAKRAHAHRPLRVCAARHKRPSREPLDSWGAPGIFEYMKSETPVDTFVPSNLLPEIEAAAEEERRAPGELVGEAIERYLSERRWFRNDEVHAKIAQGLESLRQGKGLDGETVMAELIAELDDPDAQGR
jgi:hypothetical protein